MKSLELLKGLINFLFFSVCIIFSGMVISLLYVAISGNSEIFTLEANSTLEMAVKIFGLILVFALQAVSIFYLRKFVYRSYFCANHL